VPLDAAADPVVGIRRKLAFEGAQLIQVGIVHDGSQPQPAICVSFVTHIVRFALDTSGIAVITISTILNKMSIIDL